VHIGQSAERWRLWVMKTPLQHHFEAMLQIKPPGRHVVVVFCMVVSHAINH
jgi:hypothetical protein